jgi:hypothetical protein
MARHTPGPWMPDKDGVIALPTGQRIAFAGSSANAKLIAAAPALADALELALDDFAFVTSAPDCEYLGNTLTVIRAALRLAGRLP